MAIEKDCSLVSLNTKMLGSGKRRDLFLGLTDDIESIYKECDATTQNSSTVSTSKLSASKQLYTARRLSIFITNA